MIIAGIILICICNLDFWQYSNYCLYRHKCEPNHNVWVHASANICMCEYVHIYVCVIHMGHDFLQAFSHICVALPCQLNSVSVQTATVFMLYVIYDTPAVWMILCMRIHSQSSSCRAIQHMRWWTRQPKWSRKLMEKFELKFLLQEPHINFTHTLLLVTYCFVHSLTCVVHH